MRNEPDSSISVSESWKKLQYHFLGQEGLLDQIEQGEVIKQEGVREVKVALATIHDTWKKQSTVPRQQVLLLWSVIPRLEQALRNGAYDDQDRRVSLIGQFRNWLEEIFDDSPFPMREEQALEVLLQHLLGGPSFRLELQQGHVNTSFFQDLVLRIEKLHRRWEGKEEISRHACGALFAIEQLPWPSKTSPETKQQELAEMKQILYEHINACLHGNMIEEKKEQE